MHVPLPIATLDELRAIRPYVYLATPYSRYPAGIDAAFDEACRCAAWLILHQVRVYCPIAHTHPIARKGGIDPHAHAIWLPADMPFMDGAGAIVTAMMESWRDSYGIQQEISTFAKAGKPCLFIEWPQPKEDSP